MTAYNDRHFSPPAPVAHVKLRNSRTGKTQSAVLMLIDSGADVTLLPESAAEHVGVERGQARYELVAFDGTRSVAEAVRAEIVFPQRVFRGQFLLTDRASGVLGRDVLKVNMIVGRWIAPALAGP